MIGQLATTDPPTLSVVVPCFNEEDCLQALHRRLTAVCAAVESSYEIVLVDDGSSDATWAMMRELAAEDSRVVAVKLSRNHGHQRALSCGLGICRGQRIFVIDADLQDPPELLPQMMARMDDGADVVYGQRRRRTGETPFKLLTARLFYRILARLSDVPIPMDVGDFRLMSRRVLDALNAMPEQHRFIRGMVAWIGFRQEALAYDRDPRLAGETKYPLRRMIRFALDAVASFSTRPLALAGSLSVLTALLGLGILAYAGVSYATGRVVSGWTSLVGVVAVLASAQLAILGVIGFYLGRLYEQVKGRPLYVVEEVVGGRASTSPQPE